MTQPAILRQKGNAMVMAMKNAVPVKKTPHFSSTWVVTKNLGFMNLLTTMEAKASKIARDREQVEGCRR